MTNYKSTRAYGVAEIIEMLSAIDRHLGTECSIILIGGGAAAFHGASSTTNDLDTFDALSVDLRQAIERATSETGFAMPVSHAAVADVPWNFKDRLKPLLPELGKLRVSILEKHDLVLSKTVRGDAHDAQQIGEIHEREPLDLDTLVRRFRDEMSHVMGDADRVRSQFLQLVEDLFGELGRLAAGRELERR